MYEVVYVLISNTMMYSNFYLCCEYFLHYTISINIMKIVCVNHLYVYFENIETIDIGYYQSIKLRNKQYRLKNYVFISPSVKLS